MRSDKKRQRMTILLLVIGVIISGIIIKNINFIFQDLAEAVDDQADKLSSNDKKETENKEISKKEEERLEKERLEEEQFDRERLERERLKQEKLEAEKLEQERLEEERLKKEEEAKDIDSADEKNKGKKIAYLTFDDGPSKISTPAILDILDKYNIKATFFVVGKMVKENPDILKDIYSRGHQIGNHSYSHDYSYLYKNPDNFMADIYKTEDLIRTVIGDNFDSRIIRFPGGSFERRKDPMKKAARAAGYNYIDWNALNGDAEGKKRSKSDLLKRLKETTGNKDSLVVLMHDTDAKDTTVEFLGDGIDYLIERGYDFDVLDKNYQ